MAGRSGKPDNNPRAARRQRGYRPRVLRCPAGASQPAEGRSAAKAAARLETMITGMHAIVFSPDDAKVRAFFADVLNLRSVDAGGGWLIFALPPAELAVHPADGDGRHGLYLMCDDIHATPAQ